MITSTNALVPTIGGQGFVMTVGPASLWVNNILAVVPPSVVFLSQRTTNYISLNTGTGLVQVNTTGFTSTSIPIATVVTNNFGVTSFADNRPDFYTTPNGGGSAVMLETNGVVNTSQAVLNLINGTNVTLVADGVGGVTVNATQPTLPAFQTNGTPNALQNLLNLKSGSNITLTADGAGGVTINAASFTAPVFQTDGVGNPVQTLLNLKHGSNITLTADGLGGVTITAAQPNFQTNGVNNTIQNILNLKNGTNVTMSSDGAGGVTINALTSLPNVTTTFSATPTFTPNPQSSCMFKITLTGNVTSSTFTTTGLSSGNVFIFQITQDASGGRSFVWPTNVKGGMTIDATASPSTIFTQMFVWDGSNLRAIAPGTVTA